jgi:cell division protein FtsL
MHWPYYADEYWHRSAYTARDERQFVEQRVKDLENELEALKAKLKELQKPERPSA